MDSENAAGTLRYQQNSVVLVADSPGTTLTFENLASIIPVAGGGFPLDSFFQLELQCFPYANTHWSNPFIPPSDDDAIIQPATSALLEGLPYCVAMMFKNTYLGICDPLNFNLAQAQTNVQNMWLLRTGYTIMYLLNMQPVGFPGATNYIANPASFNWNSFFINMVVSIQQCSITTVLYDSTHAPVLSATIGLSEFRSTSSLYAFFILSSCLHSDANRVGQVYSICPPLTGSTPADNNSPVLTAGTILAPSAYAPQTTGAGVFVILTDPSNTYNSFKAGAATGTQTTAYQVTTQIAKTNPTTSVNKTNIAFICPTSTSYFTLNHGWFAFTLQVSYGPAGLTPFGFQQMIKFILQNTVFGYMPTRLFPAGSYPIRTLANYTALQAFLASAGSTVPCPALNSSATNFLLSPFYLTFEYSIVEGQCTIEMFDSNKTFVETTQWSFPGDTTTTDSIVFFIMSAQYNTSAYPTTFSLCNLVTKSGSNPDDDVVNGQIIVANP